MFTEQSIVSVNAYTGSLENPATADKNGKMPVILNIVAGKAPNRIVLAGTVAENIGFEVGHSYLASCRETEADEEYGRRFQWSKLSPSLAALDLIKASKELGAAVILHSTNISLP